VALLTDHTAETVTQWLQEHPEVEVIARDRSSAYVEGTRQGAADCFHVLQNLREALGQALAAVNTLGHQPPGCGPMGQSQCPRRSVRHSARRTGRRCIYMARPYISKDVWAPRSPSPWGSVPG